METKRCLYCKEEIHKAASVCRYCHTDFVSVSDKRKLLRALWVLLLTSLILFVLSIVFVLVVAVAGVF